MNATVMMPSPPETAGVSSFLVCARDLAYLRNEAVIVYVDLNDHGRFPYRICSPRTPEQAGWDPVCVVLETGELITEQTVPA